MRMMVTGARGFVGSRIMDAADAVAAPSLRDFTEDGIRRLVDEVQPDVIVHTAAISDIPTCAANPEASWRANVEIPVWLARTGVKCLMFSTDQVYGGCAGEGPYAEDDAAPENLYARHKLEMERRTLEINPDNVMLRATWMYDMPKYGVPNRGNFLMNLLLTRRMRCSDADRRAVTYVRQVAANIEAAARLPGGAYNYGSENELSMYQTARFLSDALHLDAEIVPCEPGRSLWMDCGRLKGQGIAFDTTAEGILRCIRDYGLR